MKGKHFKHNYRIQVDIKVTPLSTEKGPTYEFNSEQKVYFSPIEIEGSFFSSQKAKFKIVQYMNKLIQKIIEAV